MATTLNIDFFKHSRAANSIVQCRIWLKFELMQNVIVILVTSENEEDPIKIEGARVATIQNIDREANSAVRGRIWSKLELIRDVMDVLGTSKNKEGPNKIKALEWPQH